MQWLAVMPHGPGFESTGLQGPFCVEFFHILPVPAWVLTCVLPQSRDMHVILTGDSKSATGFNVTLNASVCDSSDVFSPSPLSNYKLVIFCITFYD